MESADGDGYGDRVAMELARLREAIDEIRRRPIPLDADTLRHVITASLSEASAPPPNLLVTAIRRLDRVDARLESIESAVSGQGALPSAGSAPRARGGAGPASVPAVHAPAPTAVVDPEAIAEALARRLGGLAGSPPPGRGGPGPTVQDLVAALRPLVPGAARTVLRRGGREPSPQAVEVLQQAALAALDEAAGSLGPFAAQASPTRAPWPPQQLAAPAPVALAPPPVAPPPPPLDVEALASTIAVRVTASVTASVARQLTDPEPPAAPPASPQATPPIAPGGEPGPAFDLAAVADLVVARLAEQPPPQAVVSALAMVPLLGAVGNVEAAVARLAEPDEEVVGAVARLEAGVDALARALEEDRSAQADELRRGFVELTELVRDQQAALSDPFDGGRAASEDSEGDEVAGSRAVQDRTLAAVLRLNHRLDVVTRQLTPGADLPAAVPALQSQGQRLERSIGHILTAVAVLADHLGEQSSLWQAGLDRLATGDGAGAGAAEQPVPASGPREPRTGGPGRGQLSNRQDEVGTPPGVPAPDVAAVDDHDDYEDDRHEDDGHENRERDSGDTADSDSERKDSVEPDLSEGSVEGDNADESDAGDERDDRVDWDDRDHGDDGHDGDDRNLGDDGGGEVGGEIEEADSPPAEGADGDGPRSGPDAVVVSGTVRRRRTKARKRFKGR